MYLAGRALYLEPAPEQTGRMKIQDSPACYQRRGLLRDSANRTARADNRIKWPETRGEHVSRKGAEEAMTGCDVPRGGLCMSLDLLLNDNSPKGGRGFVLVACQRFKIMGGVI